MRRVEYIPRRLLPTLSLQKHFAMLRSDLGIRRDGPVDFAQRPAVRL